MTAAESRRGDISVRLGGLCPPAAKPLASSPPPKPHGRRVGSGGAETEPCAALDRPSRLGGGDPGAGEVGPLEKGWTSKLLRWWVPRQEPAVYMLTYGLQSPPVSVTWMVLAGPLGGPHSGAAAGGPRAARAVQGVWVSTAMRNPVGSESGQSPRSQPFSSVIRALRSHPLGCGRRLVSRQPFLKGLFVYPETT